jgi:hypothetical protein
MLTNIMSTVTETSPMGTIAHNIEASGNSSNSNNSNVKNADEPPPPDNSSSIGQNSNHNNNSNNNNNKHRFHNKCESLDEGTFAFMCWMNSENKKSITSNNPIVLLKFVNDKHTILYDTDLHSEVDVEINEGIPYCRYCKLDDCSHVGFAVCLEELYGHRRGRGGKEETVDDIV